jgi:hypothetical protein
MSIQDNIKQRVAALSATIPQDADPLAEARAEKERERPDYAAHPELISTGMGVTLRTGLGGLYVPYTVIAVKRGGKELDIQRDKTIIDGPNTYADEAPRHYEADPNGRVETITLRNDGTFIAKGAPKEWYATRYYVGWRRDWTDFSQ